MSGKHNASRHAHIDQQCLGHQPEAAASPPPQGTRRCEGSYIDSVQPALADRPHHRSERSAKLRAKCSDRSSVTLFPPRVGHGAVAELLRDEISVSSAEVVQCLLE